MPYSTGCTTPLSNFESSQNYKDVNDPASNIKYHFLYNKTLNSVLYSRRRFPARR